jgi:hypothetical protein
MTSSRRATNHWRKRSKKTIEDGKISHAHGLAEPIVKMATYQKQSTCSMQYTSKFQWHSSQRLKNQP